ncbi:unnamed protein product [Calicophoron daubneyi]|uniref:Uncharacterized protein n=1 Tax=Calicophoron daubneyi TaxID=300641 RepID=A0AAV2TY83_CALDB
MKAFPDKSAGECENLVRSKFRFGVNNRALTVAVTNAREYEAVNGLSTRLARTSVFAARSESLKPEKSPLKPVNDFQPRQVTSGLERYPYCQQFGRLTRQCGPNSWRAQTGPNEYRQGNLNRRWQPSGFRRSRPPNMYNPDPYYP